MSKKHGTYLVTYNDGSQIVFGNNYKPWWQHAVEFTYSTYKDPEHGWRYSDVADKVTSVKFSHEPFCDDGGLKWATPTGYQEVIDEVGAENEQTYTAFTDIKFVDSPADKAVLTKKLRAY